MATSPPKSDTRKPSDLRAEFMVVHISYSCQLIFPIDQGNEFLKIYSSACELKEDYNKPKEVLSCPPEVRVHYMTKADLAKIKFDLALGHSDD